MGVGELYGLFACMVTSRSWDAISHGIDKSAATYEEASYFMSNYNLYKLYRCYIL